MKRRAPASSRPHPSARAPARPPAPAAPIFPPRAARWLRRLALFLLTILIWRGALGTYFGADDAVLIDRLARSGLAGGPWRLLDRIVLQGEWALFGAHALPYHLVQVALHGVNAALAAELGVALGLSGTAAFACGALFAAHPLSFGCVVPPSGLGTVAGLTALLLAALAWARGRGTPRAALAAGALGILATAFRETYAPGILVLPLIGAPGAAGAAEDRRKRLADWALHVAGALAAGAALVAAALRGPLAGAAYASEPASAPAVAARYLDWLFGPYPAVPDVLSRLEGAFHPQAIALGGIVIAALAALALRGGNRAGRVGFVWLVVLTAPALLIPRHLYLYYLYGTLAGAALMLGAAMDLVVRAPRARRIVHVAAAALLVLWGGGAVRAREGATLGGTAFRADPFMRQQQIASNFVAGIREARLPRGAGAVLYPVTLSLSGPEDSTLLRNNPVTAASDSGRIAATLAGTPVHIRFEHRYAATDTARYAFFYDGAGTLTPLGSGGGVLSRMAEFWAAQQAWDRVAAALPMVLESAPGDATAWFNLTLARMHLGRAAEARAAARRFLELEPTGRRSDWARTVAAGGS